MAGFLIHFGLLDLGVHLKITKCCKFFNAQCKDINPYLLSECVRTFYIVCFGLSNIRSKNYLVSQFWLVHIL